METPLSVAWRLWIVTFKHKHSDLKAASFKSNMNTSMRRLGEQFETNRTGELHITWAIYTIII